MEKQKTNVKNKTENNNTPLKSKNTEQKSWEELNTKEKTLLIINIIVSIIGAYLVYKIIGSIVNFMGGSSWITWGVTIFSFFVFFGTMNLVQNTYEAAKKAAKK